MKNKYINGKIIDISEKGNWTKAILENTKESRDVILIEKVIIIESDNGDINNVYCNKNIDVTIGDYIYLSLSEDGLQELYKDEIEYKAAIKKDNNNDSFKEKSEKGFSFIAVLFSLLLTPILKPRSSGRGY